MVFYILRKSPFHYLYIVVTNNHVQDPSGKLVKKSFETYNPSEFVQGCTIDLGMWELEIGNTLPISDYTSGRVFLSTAQPDILLTNQIITFSS